MLKKLLPCTLLALTAFGCESMNNTQAGALGGGIIGAGVGTVVGGLTGRPLAGPAVGAAVGSGTGGLVGARPADQRRRPTRPLRAVGRRHHEPDLHDRLGLPAPPRGPHLPQAAG